MIYSKIFENGRVLVRFDSRFLFIPRTVEQNAPVRGSPGQVSGSDIFWPKSFKNLGKFFLCFLKSCPVLFPKLKMSSFSELLFANWNLESMKINFQFDSISALREDIMMSHQLIPNPNPRVTWHSFNSYPCQSIKCLPVKKIKFSRPFRHAVLWKCKSSSWGFVDSSGEPWKVLAD